MGQDDRAEIRVLESQCCHASYGLLAYLSYDSKWTADLQDFLFLQQNQFLTLLKYSERGIKMVETNP